MKTKMALAGLIVLTFACSPTQFVSSWKNSELTTPLALTKVAMVNITDHVENRREAEDQMCAGVQDPTIECVRSYIWIPQEMVREVEAVKARFAREGVDGVVTLRVIKVEQDVQVSPGYVGSYATLPHYRPYWGYYNHGWTHSSTYHSVDTTVTVRAEVNIYSLDKGLVWSGITKSTNPEDVRDLVRQVAAAAARLLREQGVIAPPAG